MEFAWNIAVQNDQYDQKSSLDVVKGLYELYKSV